MIASMEGIAFAGEWDWILKVTQVYRKKEYLDDKGLEKLRI